MRERDGQLIPSSITLVEKYVNEMGNPFGVSRAEKASWAQGLRLPSKGETLFFASCMNPLMGYGEALLNSASSLGRVGVTHGALMSTLRLASRVGLDRVFAGLADKIAKVNAEYRASLVNAVRVLQELGVSIAYLGEAEPCCGAPLYTYGLLDQFAEHAKRTYEFLISQGVKQLVTPNPICGGTFVRHYPMFVGPLTIRVRHFVEVVAERLAGTTDKLTLKEGGKVVFHDPCYLARYMNIVNQPKQVLSLIEGLELLEPANSGRCTRCCGAGGVEVVYPEIATGMACIRDRELLDTGADTFVTACPVCVMMLRMGLKRLNKTERKVSDIPDIIHRALRGAVEGPPNR